MAILVEITPDESSIPSGRRVNFIARIRNTGSAAVNFRSLAVYAVGSATLAGKVTIAPPDTVQILGTTGSLSVPFGATFYAGPKDPTAATQRSQTSVTIEVTTRSGSTDTVTTSAASVITVQPQTFPPSATPGSQVAPGAAQWDYTSNRNTIFF